MYRTHGEHVSWIPSEVDVADLTMAEAYLIEAVGRGRTDADPLADQAATDKVASSRDVHRALAAYFALGIAFVGGWCGKDGGEAARPDLIAAYRRLEVEGVVQSVVVVGPAKGIECLLDIRGIGEPAEGEDIGGDRGLQRAPIRSRGCHGSPIVSEVERPRVERRRSTRAFPRVACRVPSLHRPDSLVRHEASRRCGS